MSIELIHGDCLVEMRKIKDKSIDLVLTDPPYGITNNKQDKECEAKGDKYIVYEPSFGVTTCMGISPAYWDEAGNYHPPRDPNSTTYTYRCSNGHTWEKVVRHS